MNVGSPGSPSGAALRQRSLCRAPLRRACAVSSSNTTIMAQDRAQDLPNHAPARMIVQDDDDAAAWTPLHAPTRPSSLSSRALATTIDASRQSPVDVSDDELLPPSMLDLLSLPPDGSSTPPTHMASPDRPSPEPPAGPAASHDSGVVLFSMLDQAPQMPRKPRRPSPMEHTDDELEREAPMKMTFRRDAKRRRGERGQRQPTQLLSAFDDPETIESDATSSGDDQATTGGFDLPTIFSTPTTQAVMWGGEW